MCPDDRGRTDAGDDRSGSHLTADEQVDALRALGNEHRLAILLALGDREVATQTNGLELPFSELYDAVPVENTSQFSYHLSKLVGPFVAETDAGYRLTYAGDKIVRAVRSGLYETTPSFDPIAVAGACVVCGTSDLGARLDDERFVVSCRACDRTLLSDSFPRSQASERSPDEVVASFGYRIWSTYVLIRGDVCPECFGRVDRRVDAHESHETPGDAGQYTFAAICRTCDFTIHLPIEVPAVFHPRASAFLWDHEIPLPETPLWELFGLFVSEEWTTDVRSADPVDARFELDFEGDTLALAMDDSFAVTPVDDFEPP
ncbi:helix-turn-helix transcriptional regulator [Halosimplex litoreum]|uniref:Helix-turn-helix transcriptional regulator n=1 Tax=Halosimplex litoreum TaxID=1198301 RepID=A0A7T3FVK3_9EURY|nr:helix-turn-helix domain-containing protein [Halosimplex litoreum]QPV61546.1 helix-turn-helix transcriptional regulator [Halosimplex litoreum]